MAGIRIAVYTPPVLWYRSLFADVNSKTQRPVRRTNVATHDRLGTPDTGQDPNIKSLQAHFENASNSAAECRLEFRSTKARFQPVHMMANSYKFRLGSCDSGWDPVIPTVAIVT